MFNNCLVFGASMPNHKPYFARDMDNPGRVHSPTNETTTNGFEDKISDLVVGRLY